METISLNLEKRDGVGKGAARRTRSAGAVPGVYYGKDAGAIAIRADTVDFDRRIAHLEGAHLIETISGESALNGKKVLVREIQSHPVSGQTLHFDLLEVPLDHVIEVKVAIHLEGKPEGVAQGGILQPLIRELAVYCMPTAIPESIEVDVTALLIGDSVHLRELTLPDGVKAVDEGDPALVTVMPPVVERQDEEEGAEESDADAAVADPAEAETSKAESES
jgi:large subunit ribosomal protein L25